MLHCCRNLGNGWPAKPPNLKPGDAGRLRTVGRPEEDPFLVVRPTDARTWWRAVAYRVGNVRTLGAHSATPSGATPRPFLSDHDHAA